MLLRLAYLNRLRISNVTIANALSLLPLNHNHTSPRLSLMGTLKKKSFSRLKTEDSEVFKPKTKAKKKHTHS